MAKNTAGETDKGKDYIVLTGKWVDELVEQLKEHSKNGYSIVAYFQEHATTKILLEKEL